ncbi:MAG: lysophospholipid acyltransferase family protein [Angelakisella sp.]
MNISYHLALEFTRLLSKLLLRIRYSGRENLPTEGGYVVACNHRSLIDPVIVAHGLSRKVCYMAKAELFGNPILARIFGSWGVFPVSRGAGDMTAINHAVEILQGGGLLGIFPEGTRSFDGKPLRFKSGMAHIAKTAGVGIVPCALIFEGRMGFFKKAEMKIGTPMSYDELFGEEQSTAALKRATKLVSERIGEMLAQEEKAE